MDSIKFILDIFCSIKNEQIIILNNHFMDMINEFYFKRTGYMRF